MSNLGDYYSGCTVFDLFTMVDTQGRPSALSGNPSPFLVVYKDAFAIGGYCTVIGAVLALDCNGRTGVNAWSVATNQSPTFYACGHDYQVLLTGGCVDSLCVSGYVVGRFSLKNRAVLVPTIHARPLDVSAGGEAGVDWGNVGSPTTAVGLSCTTLFSVQSVLNSVAVDACASIFSVRSVLNSVGIGPCAAVFSVKSVENSVAIDPCSTVFRVESLSNSAVAAAQAGLATSAALTTVQADTDDIQARLPAALTGAGNIKADTQVNSDKTGYALSAAGVDAILDDAITEPSGVFAWAGATLRNIVGWLGALSSDCVQQTVTTQTLRNRANDTTLATAPLTCTSATVHRGSFT